MTVESRIVLTADASDTYAELLANVAMTYAFDGSTISFAVGSAKMTLTRNDSAKTLIDTYAGDEGSDKASFSDKATPAETKTLLENEETR